MIKKIIYLMQVPLSPHEFVDFGLEYYLSQGLGVEVWQCASFLNPACCKSASPDKISPKSFNSAKEVIKEFKNIDAASVLVINLLPRLWNTLAIFKAVNSAAAQSVEVRTNALPLPAEKLIEKIKRITPAKLFTFVLQKNIIWPKLAGRPKYIVFGGSSLRPSTAEAKHIISAHALDYDVFMRLCPCAAPPVEAQSNGGGAASEIGGLFASSPRACVVGERKKVVFLDQCFPFHSDFLVLNCAPPATKECYYPSLNIFFDLLEKKLGTGVTVAAHPRAPYTSECDYFNEREVIKGRSFSLVCEAMLVLAHTSTAVNFAVMAHVPVLLLSTNELERTEGEIIRFLGNALGSKVINIDSLSPNALPDALPDALNQDLLQINEEAYRQYFNKYIKEDGSPNLPFWQILLQDVNRLAQL